MSVLLGYPFVDGARPACEHALRAIFRQHGFFDYPVPSEASGISRKKFVKSGAEVEFYENGGNLIQLVREGKSKALDRLFLVNSSSPKATRRLSLAAAKDVLSLEKDARTGLEKVKGLPVGYPHPFLQPDGQGLVVRELRFNRSLENCAPVAFTDNSWVGGFDLSTERCLETKTQVEAVWREEVSPKEFARNELERMRTKAIARAKAKGLSEQEAQKIAAQALQEPLTNEINVVGAAMRNLAQCNQLAMTQAPKKPGSAEGTNQGSGEGSTSSGSAK